MANLKYKTRGQSSPQGKPKVWFCCHPDDSKSFFEPVCKEILDLQNCSIWYDEEPLSDYYQESFLSDLSQMRMMVVPVTSRFLYQSSRAREVEFSYAIEHHIPVLPLMQESGLENDFNKICGELQMLDKNKVDPSALPYEDKLKNFLNAILIGDKMAAKIREAFDAYVFLSYRKKDRKYAQELMRLIHENDFCRDIAIWYDEFLTPGENFNSEIGAALAKSNLFAMVVTPNLINEVNYVMTTEYPMAVKAEKRILPMELVETDKKELEEKYVGIPECTDAKDKPALSKSLLEAVQEMAIKESDSSPEHLFFIGLAYLGGIDVEIDAKRALKLIKEAAEQELPEAVKKLVDMYNAGDGVKRDCFTAIEWQKRLVELRKKQYELDKTEEKSERYYRTLWDLYDYLFDARKIEDAYETALQMEKVAMEMEHKFESHDSLNNLAISYNCLGRVIEEKGNITEALEWYQKAMMAREVLAKGIRLVSDRQSLSFSYDHMGEMYEKSGHTLEAKVWYEKALAIREEIAEDVNTIRSRRDLSYSYNNLGAIERTEGNFLEAKRWYEKSFEIAKAIAEETNTSESKEDLSVCYEKLGDAEKLLKNLPGAKQFYEMSMELREELLKEADTVFNRRSMSVIYVRIGFIEERLGNYLLAKQWYEKSLVMREEIARETSTVGSREDLTLVYKSLGDIEGKLKNYALARAWYKKGIAVAEKTINETDFLMDQEILFAMYYQYSIADLENIDYAYLAKAREVIVRLKEEHPDLERYVRAKNRVDSFMEQKK